MIQLPKKGEKIRIHKDKWQVPDHVWVPYIVGDGIGQDVFPAMLKVVQAVCEKTYAGKKTLQWFEIFAGEKARALYGAQHSLPKETIEMIKKCHVCVKGPLGTPVGSGMRSLNVALRQTLDLYVCMRPVRYFPGTPTPMKRAEQVDMVVFRENSEDIYAGIEFHAHSDDAKRLITFLQTKIGVDTIRFPDSSALGIKVISEEGSKRLVRKAIAYALNDPKQKSVTLVHKGNIMKYTEGGFLEWGYQVARAEFGARPLHGGPWHVISNGEREIVIKDVIADAFFQSILLHPEDFDVIATMNLNGDYISDALAAQVGGIGIAPGVNQSDAVMIFEPTHGTAPNIAGLGEANPLSLMLSVEMLLRALEWDDAADRLVQVIRDALQEGEMTQDLSSQIDGAVGLSTDAFAEALVARVRRS